MVKDIPHPAAKLIQAKLAELLPGVFVVADGLGDRDILVKMSNGVIGLSIGIAEREAMTMLERPLMDHWEYSKLSGYGVSSCQQMAGQWKIELRSKVVEQVL